MGKVLAPVGLLVVLALGIIGLVETQFADQWIRGVTMFEGHSSFVHDGGNPGYAGKSGGHGRLSAPVIGAPSTDAAPNPGAFYHQSQGIRGEAWARVGWYGAVMVFAAAVTAMIASAFRRSRRQTH